MAEHQQNGIIKYTYRGVVFIYCPIQNKEVMSFRSPDKTGESTGTRFAVPLLLDKTPCDLSEYEQATLAKSLRNKPQK
ncbi:hypothetical protein HJC23_014010 [Cyclotella cryptica]|uniref:Uncharacterized protein n=1 Tax=Cyclotella cryptica TaxID=29204 RepID=A0ABD3NUN6_9STRA